MPVSEELTAQINAASENLGDSPSEPQPEPADPVVDEPVDEPVIDEPAVDEPTVDEPVIDELIDGPEPTKVDIPDSPQPPVLSDESITRAIQSGMSMADVRSFTSEQSLLSVCEKLEEQVAQGLTKEDEAEEDPLAKFENLDPEEFDPNVIKLFKSLVDTVRSQGKEVASLQAEQKQVIQASQGAVSREVEQWFDKQVTDLGGDFEEALGTGGYGSLNKGSVQFQNQEAIAQQMTIMLAGYQATGMPTPPREQVFDTAARSVLGDVYRDAQEGKLRSRLDGRKKKHIQRAGGQRSEPEQVSPEEETADLVNSKYFKDGTDG